MTTTNGLHAPRHEPNWARIPPHVPTYPNPPMHFRHIPAEIYTCQDGKRNYQKWWSNWNTEFPDWREEHYRLDPLFPVMRKVDHQSGIKYPYRENPEKPPWRAEYHRQGMPETEAVRARAIYRTHFDTKDKKIYQWSNAMTSTQYKKPITSVYGPLLREEVYGVKTAHNRHGFMPALDYYF